MKKLSKTKSIQLILPIFISLIGCSSNTDKKQIKDQTDTTKSTKEFTNQNRNLGCDISATSQDFSYKAVFAADVFKADTSFIKSLFLDPVALKLEKQTEEGNEYYLYNFTDGVNKLVLFKNDGFYIENAEISNNRVRLNKKILMGMEKDVFLKLVNLKNITCDTVRVEDEEATFLSVYIFKGNKLKYIKMSQTLE